MNVAQAVVCGLKKHGIRQVFGVPGDAINFLVDALHKEDDVDYIHVAHEESGAFAAGAQAKLGAPLGACMGTAGPGAIHLLNGLYDAKKDHAPVVAITGQVHRDQLGRNAHQEIDLHALFSGVACYNQTIADARSAEAIIDAACREAIARRGVAHVSLLGDVAAESVPHDGQVGATTIRAVSPIQPRREALDAARAAIARAEHPVILAGVGAMACRQEVLELAGRIGAPIIKTLKAKALCADEHPLCVGGLGLLGIVPAVLAMEGCDLLLMLGTDYPYPDFLKHKAEIIQISDDYAAIGRRAHVSVPIHGDCGLALRELLRAGVEPTKQDRLGSHRKHMKMWFHLMDHVEKPEGETIKPQALCRLLGKMADDDALFCCDTGSVTSFFAKSLRVRAEQQVTLSGNLATMAYSIPAAIGLQLTHPDKQVITLTGDGSANMLMGELATAKNYGLPVKIFVLNNGRLHLIDFEENVEGLPQYGTELQNPDFAAVARAYGMHGLSISAPERLEAGINEALAHEGPVLVDVQVNPKQMLYPPKVTPEQALGFTTAKIKEFWQAVVS